MSPFEMILAKMVESNLDLPKKINVIFVPFELFKKKIEKGDFL
jgi:hypothetical protein